MGLVERRKRRVVAGRVRRPETLTEQTFLSRAAHGADGMEAAPVQATQLSAFRVYSSGILR
jgi:hypothetical protein